MRHAAALIVGILLLPGLAGCLGGDDAGPRTTDRRRAIQAGKAAPTPEAPEVAVATLSWNDLVDGKITFTTANGTWAVIRIVMDPSKLSPGSTESHQSWDWGVHVNATNTTDPFMAYGWSFSGPPYLYLYTFEGEWNSGGGASSSCSPSCAGRPPPELAFIVGALDGSVTLEFGFMDPNETRSTKDALAARRDLGVAPDVQGDDFAFGETIRLGSVPNVEWRERGRVGHREETASGPAAVDRTIEINASYPLSASGTLVWEYNGGAPGANSEHYVVHAGPRTIDEQRTFVEPVQSGQILHYQLPTSPGAFDFLVSSNLTGLDSGNINGQYRLAWVWVDEDLAALYGWAAFERPLATRIENGIFVD